MVSGLDELAKHNTSHVEVIIFATFHRQCHPLDWLRSNPFSSKKFLFLQGVNALVAIWAISANFQKKFADFVENKC
jgi:hypothetical protein